MTVLALIVVVAALIIAIVSGAQIRTTEGKLEEIRLQGESIGRAVFSAMRRGVNRRESPECESPRSATVRSWELDREILLARLEFWQGTRIVTALLALLSAGYLIWTFFIVPTLNHTTL